MLLSVSAVIAGFVATAVFVMGGTAIAAAALLRDPNRDPAAVVPTLYLVTNLLISFLAATIGGYVCAWIAPGHPLGHCAALAGIFEALSLATAFTSGAEPGQPPWYPWVIGLICVLGIIAGGAVRMSMSSDPA